MSIPRANKPHGPWVQTGSGRVMSLTHPRAADVDFFTDIAEGLARNTRFAGQVRSGSYSVAQHCVIGADYLFTTTKSQHLAACFLLHDAHEAYIGDIATPVAAAIADYAAFIAAGRNKGAWSAIRHCAKDGLKRLKFNLDEAIHEAAGIQWPLSPEVASIIKDTDIRLLATERQQLMAPSPCPWSPEVEAAKPLRIKGRISVLPWPNAADDYIESLKKYVPALARAKAA
jgi:uncharacterized protein